ncbi:MAG: abortive infection system antitoxin AbiGi family protein [Terracidiphilus sp.]
MDTIQRYVSNELSHFVGRGKTEEEQYDLLVNKILKSGWLTHGPFHDPSAPRGVSLDLSKPISKDEAIQYQVVCFCDIPESDLRIHIDKYSKFGIAFEKDFLIEAGACPVFYVANEGPVHPYGVFKPGDFLNRVNAAVAANKYDRALYFDTSHRALLDLFTSFDALCCTEDNRYFTGGGLTVTECKIRLMALLGVNEAQVASAELAFRNNTQAIATLRICMDFLVNYIFSFIKCFDAKRDIRDISNYYMEREWRVAGNVHFVLDDISRVFFPKKYAKRFRTDLPEYTGQISFID